MKHLCLQPLREKKDSQIFVCWIRADKEPESNQVQFVNFEETEQKYLGSA